MKNNYYVDLREELENCTFVKTILMILVVGIHCIDFWTGSWFSVISVKISCTNLKLIAEYFGSFHVFAFVLVSGYIYQFIRNEKKKYANYKLFIVNKIKRLLVPYIFCCIVWVIPITQYFYHYTLRQIINKYIFATSPGQLWFLWMLFDVFVIIWPLSNKLKSDFVAITVAVGAVLISIVGNSICPNIFCIWTALQYLPFFIVGMKIREKVNWTIRKIPILVYILIDLLLFLFYKSSLVIYNKGLTLVIKFGLNLIGSIMAFFLLQKMARKYNNWFQNSFFLLLSKSAMSIYLFHQQIVYFIIFWLNGKINPYLNAFLNFAITISVSLLISSIFMKFKGTRILIGEKR